MAAIKEKVLELPETEYPYQLPDGWKWSTLGSYFSTVKDKIDPISENEMNYIGLEHIEKNGGIIDIGSAESLKSTKTLFKKGDVLYGKLRPYLNKHVCAPFDGMCSTDILAFRSNGEYLPELLNTYLNLNSVIRYANENSKGINLPRVSAKIMEQLPIPVPPLETQKQIVAKLESMLGKINEARELISEAKESFQNRRAAILAKAFRGELTGKWREENKLPFNWQQVQLFDVADSRLGKMLDKSKNKGNPTAYLRNTNVRWFDFNLRDIQNMLVEEHELHDLYVQNGDVLICEGGEPGRCAIWRGTSNQYVFQKALHRVRVHQKMLPEWLCLCLFKSANDGSLSKLFTGTTIKHLTGRALQKFTFKLPSVEEQRLIVQMLDRFFEYEDKTLDVISLEEHINLLEKAILSQAFRGELSLKPHETFTSKTRSL